MEATEKKRGRKAAASAGVVALALLLGLSTTFAWTSFSQEAKNEMKADVNPGGRLHDDFIFKADEKDKNIYVENFTEPGNGVPIFARVQLLEYMETGAQAGKAEAADKDVTRYPSTATMDDTTKWSVHKFDDADTDYHKYFGWTTGGSTVYMPTFNKNKDSLDADIRGSLQDTNDSGQPDPYSKYTKFTVDQEETSDAAYDADDNSTDEGPGQNGMGGTIDDNYTTTEETHKAQNTLDGTVMSMAEWKAAGAKPGPYWVYDTDGWAYWAQAIEPGTSTGLLLDKVDQIATVPDTWYYGIHAVGEFVTSDEWKSAGDKYYMDAAGTKEISEDAYTLLAKAGSGNSYEDYTIEISGPEEVKQCTTAQFSAVLKKGTEEITDAPVSWSVSGGYLDEGTTISNSGLLTVPLTQKPRVSITVSASIGQAQTGNHNVLISYEAEDRWLNELRTKPTAFEAAGNTVEGSVYDKSRCEDSLIDIGGMKFYKIHHDTTNNRVMLIPAEGIYLPFGYTNKWAESTARAYLNTSYRLNFEATSSLMDRIQTTEIKTNGDPERNEASFVTTNDRFFLLTTADLLGQSAIGNVYKPTSRSIDYSYGNECKIPNCIGTYATNHGNFTRDMFAGNYSCYVGNNPNSPTALIPYYSGPMDNRPVLPAFWVDIS